MVSRATSKFGDYSVHNEWQQHKNPLFTYLFKTVKKDRKRVGELRKHLFTEATEFVIERRAEDLVYCKDAWSIPKSLLTLMRCLGSPDVQIQVSTGDRYQISFSDLNTFKYEGSDPKTISYCYVKFEHFAFERGEPESVEKSMMIGKWK